MTNLSTFVLMTLGWIAVLSVLAAIFRSWRVQAHCDSLQGPVVKAARAALDKGDVKLVLPYVKRDAETELTAAYDHVLEVRGLGGRTRELAERFFFETAVRLHRQGEGAPYTGLKAHADYGPALAAAEKALESGSVDEVLAILNHTIHAGVAERFHKIASARRAATTEGTVAADRERVETELGFQIYVHGLYEAAVGKAPHGEGAAAGKGHGH